MDTTTRVFKRSKINTDAKTGLDRYAEIIDVIMTGQDGGKVTIKGRVALLSPTLVCVEVESQFEFTRFDRPATTKDIKVVDTPPTYYAAGEDMGDGTLAIGGELKAEEVFHYETVVDLPANNKFTYLEESPVGQGIKYMLGLDLANGIVGGNWVPDNLKQI